MRTLSKIGAIALSLSIVLVAQTQAQEIVPLNDGFDVVPFGDDQVAVFQNWKMIYKGPKAKMPKYEVRFPEPVVSPKRPSGGMSGDYAAVYERPYYNPNAPVTFPDALPYPYNFAVPYFVTPINPWRQTDGDA